MNLREEDSQSEGGESSGVLSFAGYMDSEALLDTVCFSSSDV